MTKVNKATDTYNIQLNEQSLSQNEHIICDSLYMKFENRKNQFLLKIIRIVAFMGLRV